MAIPQFNEFCRRVCSVIRWRAARRPVADELAAHLEDHAAALMERGISEEEATQRALEAMGDPYALGAELDRTPPPTVPRLSLICLVLGLLVLLAGLGRGLHVAGVAPQAPELPSGAGYTLVIEGSAAGGGILGDYTFTPSRQAGLAQAWLGEYEIQLPLTAVSSRPWLPSPHFTALAASYTDNAGGSGSCSLWAGKSYLLGASGMLLIAEPTPGATEFSITLSAPTGESIFFTVTLNQEVPPS